MPSASLHCPSLEQIGGPVTERLRLLVLKLPNSQYILCFVACLFVCSFVCLLVCLFVCLLACLPACMLACLLALVCYFVGCVGFVSCVCDFFVVLPGLVGGGGVFSVCCRRLPFSMLLLTSEFPLFTFWRLEEVLERCKAVNLCNTSLPMIRKQTIKCSLPKKTPPPISIIYNQKQETNAKEPRLPNEPKASNAKGASV